jgi:hypothetical protein
MQTSEDLNSLGSTADNNCHNDAGALVAFSRECYYYCLLFFSQTCEFNNGPRYNGNNNDNKNSKNNKKNKNGWGARREENKL